MRHSDIRTTMNIYGDVVTDEMTTACARPLRLTLRGLERKGTMLLIYWFLMWD